jgi:hypothetical protein
VQYARDRIRRLHDTLETVLPRVPGS